MSSQPTLFERVGGYEMIQKVHKIFYDKIYADEWIGQFFKEIKQDVIENQQTDFMVQAMGGPDKYCGAFPIPAHKHMYITPELFQYRHEILKASLIESGLAQPEIDSWLKIDAAFGKGIVKKSIADCELRFPTDEIQNFPRPDKYKKTA